MIYPDAPDLVSMSYYVEGMHTERLAFISLLEERIDGTVDASSKEALQELLDTITDEGW
ncbi:hypothetical protein UFOVP111_45 [uncultured Caudovirales phage]|uniref:Uncharacterized protein n=1 Tax=uncultured Caudovirales phage TaxID=2100421 RepID=A0A6J5L186_9CAUD|nr:hypothetical protein UFOVP111_45 [uncultured Caudovirales phage]